MPTDNAQYIDNLIQIIKTAEDPESVTNEQVARIFAFLCSRIKELQEAINTTPSVSDETANRIAADQYLQRLIANTVDAESSERIIADNRIKADLSELESKWKLANGFLQRRIDTLLSESSTDAIDNFNEIKQFLANFKDSDSLASMLGELRLSISNLQRVADKQNSAFEKLTPIRIESEEALEAMRLLGLLKDGQIYYISEED